MLNKDAFYTSYLYTCNRCRSCIHRDGVHPVCPADERLGFFTFSAGGKIYMAQGILEKKLRPTLSSSEAVFSCFLCGACEKACPEGIETMTIFRDLRHEFTKRDILPRGLQGLRGMLGDWKMPSPERGDVMILGGCRAGGKDPSFVKSLKKNGVNTLGQPVPCCGGMALLLGDYGLFEDLALATSRAIMESGVTHIICLDPLCAWTIKEQYPETLRPKAEVMTAPEFLKSLVESGRIAPGPLKKKVTYHDPCFLGRYMGQYDLPRDLLSQVPGITMREMWRGREKSLCCGGGGGVEASSPEMADDLARERITEAADTGAEVLVTACPKGKEKFLRARGPLPRSMQGEGRKKKIAVLNLWEVFL